MLKVIKRPREEQLTNLNTHQKSKVGWIQGQPSLEVVAERDQAISKNSTT